MPPPKVSVVSLTWNSRRTVEPMLRTLLDDVREASFETEIFVVDNGSTDGTLEHLRAVANEGAPLVVVPLGKNRGTTVSRNIALRMARGQYLLVLDSDTEIPRGTLTGLVESLNQIPDRRSVGVVCPLLLYPDGEFQESARRFPTVFTKTYRLLGLEAQRSRDESLPRVLAREVTPVDYAISAAWFVPRSTFDRVGLLDERIFYAPEDVEFCARVWAHGLKVWYYPKVSIVHNCQRLTNKRPLTRLGLSHMQGLVRYWWEHGAFLSRPPLGAEREPRETPDRARGSP